ncbi:MAG: serine/threonine protein kinase [Nannocystis sp.]|nr:serine/threonine-protein kinase [Nannocystis sp.]MBA3549632.1 serine/threonine protein kinase [Nannocystis sp.]
MLMASHRVAPSDPRGTVFAGRYVLRRELGRGGMGAVYEAFDLREWRVVALKKIEPQSGRGGEMFEERFQREIRAVAGVGHPGIPTLYGSGRSPEGVAFYTMEIVAGERLRKLLEGGALEPIRAIMMAIDLGRALAAAHEAGVVHRDVKPANILIEPGGRVRLIDFGACSFLPHFFTREVIGSERITATHNRWATGDFDVVATPGYSAPEISQRDEETTPRADIYSLCAVLYEMIQGRPLFDKQAHRDRMISPDEFVPELRPLAEVLISGTSHETYERHKSMAELVQALEIVQTGARRARAVDRPLVAEPPTMRRTWWFTAGMGIVAAGVIFLAWARPGSAPGTLARLEAPAAEVAVVVPPQAPTAAPSDPTGAGKPAVPAANEPDPEPVAPPEVVTTPASTSTTSAPLDPSPRPDPGAARMRRRLASYTPQVKRCVATFGAPAEILELQLDLGPTGRVREVQLPDGGWLLLRRCIATALADMSFPPGTRSPHHFRVRTGTP